MSRYSRLESTEEKRNFRSAVVLVFLTISVVVGFLVFGIPLTGRLATFISGIKGSRSAITSTDKTPPAPPRINYFPDFTNQQVASISGTAEPGATVKLNLNGKDQNVITDKDGKFSFNGLSLNVGANTFSATAVDFAGNISQSTQTYTINFSNTPPKLSIDSPADGSKYYGSTQNQVSVQGTTDPNTSVTINDRIVAVDDSGHFSYTVMLSSGDNKFTVKAVDPAGNSTEKDITLSFSQ